MRLTDSELSELEAEYRGSLVMINGEVYKIVRYECIHGMEDAVVLNRLEGENATRLWEKRKV